MNNTTQVYEADFTDAKLKEKPNKPQTQTT